jgi:hypothetical protein
MKRKRRHCQSFSITLPDGQVVHGQGQFTGPITERDREAIAAVVAALKARTHAEQIDSVSLTKPDS